MYKYRNKFEEASAHLANKKEELELLENSLKELNNNLASTNTAHEDANTEYIKCRETFNNLETQKGGLESVVESINKNIANLKKSINAKDGRLEGYKAEYNNAQEQIQG